MTDATGNDASGSGVQRTQAQQPQAPIGRDRGHDETTASQDTSVPSNSNTQPDDDEAEEDDGPPEDGAPLTIPGGGLAGLKARKQAERVALGIQDQPEGGRAGRITLPHQDVRTRES